ncbi:MAG: hypothetical protein NTY19_12290, partial [Planctomycetota bacterium]|nr:hypothetical protein [Planctomycetota bacterium]
AGGGMRGGGNAGGGTRGGGSGFASPSGSGGQPSQGPATGELDLTKPAKVKLNQVLDLIGKQVQVTFKGAKQPTILTSPFENSAAAMQQYLPKLMDEVTAAAGPSIPGRLNVNQAPRQILAGIPGLRAEVVDQIVRIRDPQNTANQPQRQNETWLLTEGLVTLDEMRKLMPFLCAGGDVYRAQVVGYFESGYPAARAEVVLDAVQSPPRVLLWRNMTHLGRGFGLDALGTGQGVGQGVGL